MLVNNNHKNLIPTWTTGKIWMKSKPWIWCGSSLCGHFILGSTATIFSVKELKRVNYLCELSCLISNTQDESQLHDGKDKTTINKQSKSTSFEYWLACQEKWSLKHVIHLSVANMTAKLVHHTNSHCRWWWINMENVGCSWQWKKLNDIYIFWPMVRFSWKSKSTSMSTLHVSMHHTIPPTTCNIPRNKSP